MGFFLATFYVILCRDRLQRLGEFNKADSDFVKLVKVVLLQNGMYYKSALMH